MAAYTSISALLEHLGGTLGGTGWQVVDQRRIDAFAEVTGDRQWIHVDRERARTESPYGTTVAHGALTLALGVAFLTELLDIGGVRLVVNGGLNKVRFRAPVLVDSRVRGTATLVEARTLTGGARIVVRVTVEIEGESKPACVADQVLVLYE